MPFPKGIRWGMKNGHGAIVDWFGSYGCTRQGCPYLPY
jgi:hypothetical protein